MHLPFENQGLNKNDSSSGDLLQMAVGVFRHFMHRLEVVGLCSMLLRLSILLACGVEFSANFVVAPGLASLICHLLLQIEIKTVAKFNLIVSAVKLSFTWIVLELGLQNTSCFVLFMIALSRMTQLFEHFQLSPMPQYMAQQLAVFFYVYVRTSDDLYTCPVQIDKLMVILSCTSVEFFSFRDIKGLKEQLIEQLERARKLEARWFNFLKELQVGILIFDPQDLKIQFCNKSVGKIFDIEVGDFCEVLHNLDTVPIQDKQSNSDQSFLNFIRSSIKMIQSKQVEETNKFVVKIKHSKKVLEVSFQRCEEKEDLILTMVNDITDMRNFQKIKQLQRLKTIYFCSVSHDLRTPINSIQATVGHLLAKFSHQQDCCYLLRVIQSSCGLLLRIVEDVTDLSRIELKQMRLEMQWFDLEGLFREVEEAMKLPFEMKKIGLQFYIDDSCLRHGPTLLSDPKRLKQILFNLVGNALKFTFKGQVTVSACLVDLPEPQGGIVEEAKGEEEEAAGVEKVLRVKVADEGVGIRRENMGQLFRLFGKKKEASDANKQGIGLGLTICHKLCELLGGDISLESSVGVGTCITFTIKCSARNVNSWSQSFSSASQFDCEQDSCRVTFDEYLKTKRMCFLSTSQAS